MRLRVKREAYPWLAKASLEVNNVWNYCNEISFLAATRTDKNRKWLSGFDLCKLTSGATEFFERIGADTIQSICVHYAQKRRAAKRLKLRWRSSTGPKRSLGWIPFKAASIKRKGNAMRFAGKTFRVFEFDKLANVKWRDGCFAQDAVGDWWLCLPVQQKIEAIPATREAVGIDLGIKTIATTSDGEKLDAGRWVQASEAKLAQAQRRGHKQRAKRLHRKIARRRLDAIHKFTTRIVRDYQFIAVGDVSSRKLVKTRMAKSVLDSGWGILKAHLLYKGQQAGRCVKVVDEKYTTRVCGNCGALTGPKGVEQLVVRTWRCADCGESHDRDINAARNILQFALRHQRPFAGTSLLPNRAAA